MICYFIIIAFLDLLGTSQMFKIVKVPLSIIAFIYTIIYIKEREKVLAEIVKQEEIEKQRRMDEKIRKNLLLQKQKQYYSYKQDIEINLPNIVYIENSNKTYLNNEERLNYLNNLINHLKQLNENLELRNLDILIEPHLDTINKILHINNEIINKININVLEDLNIYNSLIDSKNNLENYYKYLKSKAEIFKNDYYSILMGNEGEEAVNNQLSIYNDILHNFSNIRFEVDGISIENDNLIVSPFGVFSIEVKNMGVSSKFTIKLEKDGRWKRIYNNGNEEIMKNVTEQTYRHVGLVQKMLNNRLKEKGYLGEYIYVQTLIVFANENVNIINESDIPVLRISNIYHHIINNSKQKLDENTIKLIIEIIENEKLELKKYEIEEIKEYLFDLVSDLEYKMKNYNKLYTQLQTLNSQL